jgi:hypothetical protein
MNSLLEHVSSLLPFRINGVKVYYTNGHVQQWGSWGDNYLLIDNLLNDPIVSLSYASDKYGEPEGQLIGYMRGLRIKRKSGQTTSKGQPLKFTQES